MEQFILMGVILPACAGAILLGAAWFALRWEHRRCVALGSALCAAALGASFLISFLMVEGWGGWPPSSRWHWIVAIVAAATVLAVLLSFIRGRASRVVTAVVGSAGLVFLFQPPPIVEAWTWRAVLGVGIVGLFILMDLPGRENQQQDRWLLPVAFTIAFVAASVVIMQAHFSKLAFMAAAMAATCGIAALLAMVSSRLMFLGGLFVVAAALPAALVIGRLYDQVELPSASFLLVWLSPLGVWTRLLPGLKGKPVAGAAAGLVAAVAIAFAAGAMASLGTVSEDTYDLSEYGY